MWVQLLSVSELSPPMITVTLKILAYLLTTLGEVCHLATLS